MNSSRLGPTAPVVVITGASSGIGRATARAFACEGARLVLAARAKEALDYVVSECHEHGSEAVSVICDVTDAQAVRDLAQAAISQFGGIDIWVNNVGVGAVGRYDLVPMEAHKRVVESNLLGHMYGAHAVIPHFRERGRGTLINMISIGGWLSAPYAAAYTASKFALRGLGQSLRAELSDMPDIHVCDVYPAFVNTPGVGHGANYTGRHLRPVPPLLDPDLVAARVVELASDPRPVVTIGSVAWMGRFTQNIAPGLRGSIMRRMLDFAFSRANLAPQTDGNLFDVSRTHDVRGGYRARNGRGLLLACGAAAGVAAIAWLAARGVSRSS